MKNSVGRLQILISQPHAPKGLIIEDIDAATPVNEYLSEFISTNLRCYHQGQLTRIIDPWRVILFAPYNGLF